jgi:hypothetical protein
LGLISKPASFTSSNLPELLSAGRHGGQLWPVNELRGHPAIECLSTKPRGGCVNHFHPYTRARALMARPWSARCYGVARQREGSRQNSIGPRVNLFYHPYTRARALMARQRSARCYGVARQREGSRQNSIGLRRAFSPAFRAGSLYPLARGCRRSWRGEGCNYGLWLRRRRRRFRFRDFRFEAAAATLSGTGSASPRPDRNSGLRGRVYLICLPYTRARGFSKLCSSSRGAGDSRPAGRHGGHAWIRTR